MSSEIAIRVDGLSKCYKIYGSPRDRLKQFVVPRIKQAIGLQPKQYYREFWALQDISFEIKKGETVGIIGRNGSGKSTLLQIICGTLNPSKGEIKTIGRISALLELGSGFNPEFTGRENVYMNAAVLGLSRQEIDDRFEDIAKFADIGSFINQPVKVYSSGMYVRLAFAVAINVKPDILIIDEALAVGDEPFQRKCYSEIERIRESGATILLVSHSASSIIQMCSRALLLDHGCRLFMGSPKSAVESYYRLVYSNEREIETIKQEIKSEDMSQLLESNDKVHVLELSYYLEGDENTIDNPHVAEKKGKPGYKNQERYDSGLKPLSTINYEKRGAEISNVRIENNSGKKINVLAPQKKYWYCFEVDFYRSVENVHFGMLIKTTTGNDLGAIGSHPNNKGIPLIEKDSRYLIRFPFINIFSPGTYFMNAGCSGSVNGQNTFLHRIIDALAFRVESTKTLLPYAGAIQISDGAPEIITIAK